MRYLRKKVPPEKLSINYQNDQGNEIGLKTLLPIAHGTYFVVTGIWPLISSRTFQLVTGPKYDVWLVKTIGLLISLIGLLISWSAFQKRPSNEIAMLAIGSSAALSASDVVYSAKRRISPVYPLDALVEIGLGFGWVFLLRGERSRRR